MVALDDEAAVLTRHFAAPTINIELPTAAVVAFSFIVVVILVVVIRSQSHHSLSRLLQTISLILFASRGRTS
jgi:hypothetical protein